MINGDISNETPPRIIVIIDAVVQSDLDEERRLLLGSRLTRRVTGLNNAALSFLWNKSFKFGLSVELAAFESELWTQEHIDKLMARLENRGGNPFNYSELYPSIDEFIGELPYRTNLKGVLDIPSRVARYGSWGIELENL
ncbi:hypothetical protein UFOVP221_118 [uncultured Caudovirales phage]|uniref:Uncharacterized protein n=1 Tax=uncultured Caudovirales phage TaxID=2100421 RepID=A0A6J7WNT7_9CAUD|nr:hypothetical protein UFOVP221_118 [uncultured Caudovirales phage]